LKDIQVDQKSKLMVDKLPFGECAYINRPPPFYGVSYQFWEVRMQIFVESIDKVFESYF